MRDCAWYLILPFRDLDSAGKIVGAVVTVGWNLFVAWDRLGGLPDRKYYFAFNLFAVGYHMALIEKRMRRI